VKRVRKLFVTLVAIFVLVGLMVGIGLPAVAQTPAVTPVPSPVPSPAVTPAGSPLPTLPAGSTVEVLAVWGGTELESFRAMVAPWEQQTGGQMNFTGTRDLTAILTTRIQAGNPPDVAILPNPGLMRQFADAGNLEPLDEFLDMDRIEQEYTEAWIDLGTVDDDLYAIFMKATNKGIIWYNPQVFEENNWEIPQTWDELIELSDTIVEEGETPDAPWSVGVEAAQASGFAGTDWIAQLFLAEFGGEAYDQWVNHEIPWTDPRVKEAWEKFGTIVFTEGYVPGGATAALATNFQDASYLPFTDPPRAAMYYEGDFVQGFLAAQFPDLEAGEDYAFFPFPAVGAEGAAAPAATPSPVVPSPAPGASPAAAPMAVAVTGGADLVVAFRDTPAVRSFVNYLSTAEAQEIWVERGGFTSLNSAVDLDAYPNELARQSAEMLVNADLFRFGAGDIMPAAVQTTWWQGVLQYLQNRDQLDTILQNIENAAMTAYPAATPAASPGASPVPSPAPVSPVPPVAPSPSP